MELYISISILVLLAILYPLLAYIHYPKKRVSGEVKAQIMSQGLIHFTTIENAKRIQQEGLKPGMKKAMFAVERDFVWMYINDADEFQTKLAIIHSKGERDKYDAVVVFQEITEEQIRKMRYRKNDMAVVHNGRFTSKVIEVFELGSNHRVFQT